MFMCRQSEAVLGVLGSDASRGPSTEMAAVIEPSENPGATAAQTEEYKPSMSEAQFDTLFIGQSHVRDLVHLRVFVRGEAC